jgi:hypothetical protein
MPRERHGQEAWTDVHSFMGHDKARRPGSSPLCRTAHSAKQNWCMLITAGTEGKHGHHRRSLPGPFIAISFPLASLCAGVATSGGHPRRVAVIWLDGNPGLGRVGFDRSDNVKSALRDALFSQTKHRTAKRLEQCQRLSRRRLRKCTHRRACPFADSLMGYWWAGPGVQSRP